MDLIVGVLRLVAGVAGLGLLGYIYIFPLFAARKAYKKGRRGWGNATLICWPCSVGWIPGTIAWFQPSMEELAAGSGAQGATTCPACNGASVQVGRTATYREDGKKAWTKSTAMIFLVGGGIMLALCVVLGVGMIAFGGEGASQLYQWTNNRPSFVPDWVTPDQFMGFWALVVGLLFFAGPAARGAMLLSNYEAKVQTTYNFTCRGCKNKWSVGETAPSA